MIIIKLNIKGEIKFVKSTTFLTDKLYQYLQTVSLREPRVLTDLRTLTAELPGGIMQVSPEQAQFMMLIIELMGAKKILELGVYTGYSSTAMALALPEEGQLIACDITDQFTHFAHETWRKAEVDHKIVFHLMPANELLDLLIKEGNTNTFDFIFIDADKANYDQYYEMSLALIRKGGLIAIDNTLWSGRVADLSQNDMGTLVIRKLNEKLLQDQRISLSLIPIGDGLTLARKK